jgi:hypothetical protein
VLAAYADVTASRQPLAAALSDFAAIAARLGIVQRVVLDGSSVTSTRDPGDIDLVVLTPGVYQPDGEQRFLSAGADLVALDIQFAHDVRDFDLWVEFFTTQRDSTRKGAIEMLI